jgi:hypothetical protein
MPFGEPYLLLHKWEGQLKGRPQIALYLVNPLEPETPCGDFEIVDLQPIMINGNKIFLYGDRATFFAKEAARDKNYACSVVPSVWRIMPGNEAMNNGNRPENAAASNVLDPIMTMLLILNTRNVKRETIRVADKLNKSRVRSGKPMIPPYDVVNAAPYVTAILAAGTAMASRDAAKGGTHASPIPHIRQGHMRHYPSGRRTFIAETLVNVAPEAREGFLSKRSHYEVKQ